MNLARRRLQGIFDRLLRAHGPQQWWPGESVFEIMVGAVLTQNTAWRNVARAIDNLRRAEALHPAALLAVHPRRLATYLQPSGYFNVKAKRVRAMTRWLLDAGGTAAITRWPTVRLRAALLAVHGIGPETADDILLYAFNRPVFVIDAYTRRIFSRLGLVSGQEGYETLRAAFEAALPPDAAVYNEYHALIVAHGKDVCRVRPCCETCVLRRGCRYARSGARLSDS